MPDAKLSRAAECDLLAIGRYTVRYFGEGQAWQYSESLDSCFDLLADNPHIGRVYDHIRPGLRRHDHKSHSVYYMITDYGILIVRVLHDRQDPGLSLI